MQLDSLRLDIMSLSPSDLRRRNSFDIDGDRNLVVPETIFSTKFVISLDSNLLINPNHETYASE